MLKKYLLFLGLIMSYSSFSQTEKGVWSVNGKMNFRRYISEDTYSRNPPKFQFAGELDLGLFVKKDNFIGLKGSIGPFDNISSRENFVRYNYNKRRNFQAIFRRYAGAGKLRMYLEIGGRYTAYVKRRSEQKKIKEDIFALSSGIGLTYFLNPNVAFEMQLNTPLYATNSANNKDWYGKIQTRLFLNNKQPYQTDTIDLMFDYFERGYFSIGLQTDFDFSLDNSRPLGNSQVNFSIFYRESYRFHAFFDISRGSNDDGGPYFLNDSYFSFEYISLFLNRDWFFAQTGVGVQGDEEAYLFVGFGFGFPVRNKGFWRLGMNGQHNHEGNEKLHFFIEREIFLYENLSFKGNVYFKTKPFSAESYEISQVDYGLSLGFNYFILKKNK